MKAEDTVRILEFVKENRFPVERPSKSEVRKHFIAVVVLFALVVLSAYMTWVSWSKEWDTLIGVFGALTLVMVITTLKQAVNYLEVKRKSKMSYAELISEEKENRERVKKYAPDDDWDDDRSSPYDPINSYSHYWMD